MLLLCCLGGCRSTPLHPTPAGSVLSAGKEEEPALGPHQVADVQIAMGHSLEKQGGLEEARTAYLEALNQDPERADAYERLAVVSYRLGKSDEGEEWCQKAQRGGKSTADLHCNQGYSQYLRGHWDEAEKSLLWALVHDSGHRCAHNNLGLVLAQMGRNEAALAEFRKASCSEVEAYTNLGFALTLKGDWSAAQAQYGKALAADPSFAQAKEGLRRVRALQAQAARSAGGAPARGE